MMNRWKIFLFMKICLPCFEFSKTDPSLLETLRGKWKRQVSIHHVWEGYLSANMTIQYCNTFKLCISYVRSERSCLYHILKELSSESQTWNVSLHTQLWCFVTYDLCYANDPLLNEEKIFKDSSRSKRSLKLLLILKHISLKWVRTRECHQKKKRREKKTELENFEIEGYKGFCPFDGHVLHCLFILRCTDAFALGMFLDSKL